MVLAEVFELEEGSALYEQALTHPSFANENKGALDNQRLEFLGDAILNLCTSELLWERFPEADEGALTRMRAELVNAEALAAWAREHGIDAALRMGRGARGAGLAPTTNVMGDAVEALIAAGFLTGGLAVARRVCARIVEAGLSAVGRPGERDPKSQLQEELQALRFPAPIYRVLSKEGPAHERQFEVLVLLAEKELGRGRGRSKREAERNAASLALRTRSWQSSPATTDTTAPATGTGIVLSGEDSGATADETK